MEPTKDEVDVALRALRDDADKWTSAAADIATAARTAATLGLGAREMTGVADLLGVTAIYTAVQTKLAGLLGEAEAATNRVSDALRTSAQTYQDEDQAGVHRLNGVW